MKTKPFIFTSIFGTVILLAAAGSGLYITEMNKKNLANGSKTASVEDTPQKQTPEKLLSVAEITTIASSQGTQSGVSSIIMEKNDETYAYKASYNDGKVIFYDARNGKQIDRSHFQAEKLPQLQNTKEITADTAGEIAVAHAPTLRVSHISSEKMRNELHYIVTYNNGLRVTINASDGKIKDNVQPNTSQVEQVEKDTPAKRLGEKLRTLPNHKLNL